MISSIRSNAGNIPGWRTRRKIVVFESDDWGSIGIPSEKVYKDLLARGIIGPGEAEHYYKYDALESNEDLSSLFEVLASVRDRNGNCPVFTGMNVVANPDFDKIEQEGFQTYHYESVSETLGRYPNHDQVLRLWKEGYDKRLFVPQFHGREHLNVAAWMKGLGKAGSKTREAFHMRVFGIDPVAIGESPIQYRAAFDIESEEELGYLASVIREGTAHFEELMGYRASVFVPPNGPFNLSLESTLEDSGIRYLVLDKLQKEPVGGLRYRTRIRYIGRKSQHNQVYLSRNAGFEPSGNNSDWVDSCLSEIRMAFRWRKPATISTHRVNYTGSLDPANRERGLAELHRLLITLLKRWPDVEFMSSDQLGDLINQ